MCFFFFFCARAKEKLYWTITQPSFVQSSVFSASSESAVYIMRHQDRVEVVIDGQHNNQSLLSCQIVFYCILGRDHDLFLELRNNQTEVQPEVMYTCARENVAWTSRFETDAQQVPRHKTPAEGLKPECVASNSIQSIKVSTLGN